jgi:hypothetical protein
MLKAKIEKILEENFHRPDVIQIPGMEKDNCFICGISFDEEKWKELRKHALSQLLALLESVVPEEKEVDFTYLAQPPRRYTFEQPQLKLWTEKWCKGKVLNLFAGTTKLNVDEFRVDIDKNCPADWYGDAYEFVTTTDLRFDTIVFDPPYNLRKAREKYGGRYIGLATKIKNKLPKILNQNGRIISFGYDTVGMSKSRGFNKIAICLVCHNGDHQDTLCLVEANACIAEIKEKIK